MGGTLPGQEEQLSAMISRADIFSQPPFSIDSKRFTPRQRKVLAIALAAMSQDENDSEMLGELFRDLTRDLSIKELTHISEQGINLWAEVRN